MKRLIRGSPRLQELIDQNGHDACVSLLLAAKASTDLANKEGVTPLFMAVQEGHDASVAAPLAANAASPGDERRRDAALLAAQ